MPSSLQALCSLTTRCCGDNRRRHGFQRGLTVLETLLLTGQIPEIDWEHGDDLCDCTFQRIGYWTNPYLARTLKVRLCCAWKVLAEQNPEIAALMQEIPAYDDYNGKRWVSEPAAWNSKEGDMPRALWHRQLSIQQDKPLEQVRREYDHLEPPRERPVSGARFPRCPRRLLSGAHAGANPGHRLAQPRLQSHGARR